MKTKFYRALLLLSLVGNVYAVYRFTRPHTYTVAEGPAMFEFLTKEDLLPY